MAAIAGVFAYVGMGGTRAAPEDRLLSAIFGDNKELDLQLDEVIDGLATAAGSGDQAVVWQLLGKVNDTNSLHRATRIFLAQLSQHEALMAHITQFADDEFPDTSIQDAARQALNKLSGSL